MRSSPPPARRPGQTVRWLAIAAGAVLLASCRSMSLTAPVSPLAPLPAIAAPPAVAVDAVDTVDMVLLLPVESPAVAAEPSERSSALPTIRDGEVQRTGLDLPSPPLPRLGPAAAFPVAAVAGGRCQGPDCQPHAGPGSPRGGCGSPA